MKNSIATDPNARPAIPGRRSATLNAHGDVSAASVVRVWTCYGDSFYVDREALAGDMPLLRQYTRAGKLKGRMNYRARTFTQATPIARANIIHVDGASVDAEAAAADSPNTTPPAPAYKAGDVVHYFNGYDLYIGEKTILSVAEADEDWQPWMERRYYITPTDTPWFAVGESYLVPLHALPRPLQRGDARPESLKRGNP